MNESRSASPRRRTASAATIGAVMVMFGATSVPASADSPATCNGQPATITATDDGDRVTGTDGDDVVSLGAGYDTFRGGPGDDVACGGPGQDSLVGDGGSDSLTGGGGADYNVIGGPGADVVHGGAGDDMRILGDDAHEPDYADEVYGDGGDDWIDGEPGAVPDAIDGGPGHDILNFYLSGRSVTIDVAARTATGDAVDTFTGLETYWGSEYTDHLIGSSAGDRLVGVYGDDLVEGRGGDDVLTATGGTITGGPGRDTFAGPDEAGLGLTVDLGPGADRAVLDALRDSTVAGGPGDDVFEVPKPIFGSDADGTYARLLGGSGDDRLTFSNNPHRVRVDVRAGRVAWSRGRLTFAHLNEFRGSNRADALLGTRDADRLFGRGGDDVLRGRRGPDLLRGGDGDDTAYGGDGRDVCAAELRFSCRRG